jgi:adenylyl- and sulfurtransferase ThiI
MSWGVTASGVNKENVEESLNENFGTQHTDPLPGVTAQFEEARDIVVELIDGNTVRGETFNVSCSGHYQNDEQTDSLDHFSVTVGAAS